MSSTMIILKAYEEYGLKQEKFWARRRDFVIEDIAGIFMMIILSTISVSQSVSGLAVFQELGILFIELAIWLLLGIYLIPSLLKKIRLLANDEMMLVVSVGICMEMEVDRQPDRILFGAGSIYGWIYPGWYSAVGTDRAYHYADQGSVWRYLLCSGRHDDRSAASDRIYRADPAHHSGYDPGSDDLCNHWDPRPDSRCIQRSAAVSAWCRSESFPLLSLLLECLLV